MFCLWIHRTTQIMKNAVGLFADHRNHYGHLFLFCCGNNCFRCTFGITSNVVCNKELIKSFRINFKCRRIKFSNSTTRNGKAMATTTTCVKTRNNTTLLDGIMRCTRNPGCKRNNFYPSLVAKCYNQETEPK